MEATFVKLEHEYCPPIDSALFSAIVSDFDLGNDESITAARETLEAIKASALEQDSADFDPSGSAIHGADFGKDGALDERDASSETEVSASQETDLTSLSNGVKKIKLDPLKRAEDSYLNEEEKLDNASKEILLTEMFPESSVFTIAYTLNKCDGNWNRALEELLNQTFLNDGAQFSDGEDFNAKGIEAFSEDQIVRRGRKKKTKQQRRTLDELSTGRSSSLPSTARVSPWEKAQKDIAFLDSRVNLEKPTLSSLYHKNGASLSVTIKALIESALENESRSTDDDSVRAVHAFELGKDFPSLNEGQRSGLVRLTHPSTAAAHELAKAFTTPENGQCGGGGGAKIEIIQRYAAINVDTDDNASNDDSAWQTARRRTARSSGTSTPVGDPKALANTYLDLQERSFSQAAAAYRRGKSDHLMGAAASYYSQQGRDFASKRAEVTADAADALVKSQSSRDEIDLHGVTVKDAVRIARDMTQSWWRQHGRKVRGVDGRLRVEEGAADGRGDALRIVTGVGRHSSGGIGKLGPAVGRMLVTEGWSFRAEEGVLTVYGKRS